MKNKILTGIFILAVFLFILTVSISLPIYHRYFYFLQIDSLQIIEDSGYSKQVIKDAFNDVMNYLTIPWAEFATGELIYSAEGKAHFADCKKLFNLNAIVLLLSSVTIVVLLVLHRKKRIKLLNIFGFNPALYSAILAITLPLLLGGIIAIDFGRAFEVFHKLFFYGKDNWVFDTDLDQIINILPQEFFMNCAIFIGVGIFVISSAIIIYSIINKLKSK